MPPRPPLLSALRWLRWDNVREELNPSVGLSPQRMHSKYNDFSYPCVLPVLPTLGQ